MLDCDDIGPVLERIRVRLGIDFSQYRETTLRRRIGRRAVACNCADIASYSSLLDDTPEEYARLISDLTIKYTEFFRDDWVFDTIQENLLPTLFDHYKNGGEIDVWSAGCATGEETYSLSALLLHQSGQTDSLAEIKVLGTDLDPAAVITARIGSYIKDYLPKQVNGWASAYFIDDGKNVSATPWTKNLVRFETHDLTSESAVADAREISPSGFDLILCRNVLMYLHRQAQLKVLKACVELLKPGGFLIIGTGEVIPADLEGQLRPVIKKARVYEKSTCAVQEE